MRFPRHLIGGQGAVVDVIERARTGPSAPPCQPADTSLRRRRMGVTAVREFARHHLRRAAYVGVPRAVVEQMMQQEASM